MNPRRLRLTFMAAIVAEAGLVSLAWSQTWFVLSLSDAKVPVPGSIAGGALLPVALASLALLAALALAGPFFRVVLGVLDAMLGVCLLAISIWALSDPVRASLPSLIEATGISGEATLRAMVSGIDVATWPVVALVLGGVMVITGIGITVTGRGWPIAGARYSRTRIETPDGTAIQDWDALTEGDDPTEES